MIDKLKYRRLKEKAIRLRKQGLSYNEIKKQINVSKSTLSFWLKNIKLTESQRKSLYTRNVLLLSRGPQSQKERRKREIAEIIKQAEQEIEIPFSFETYRLLGAALYWGEGSKTSHFAVSNSDPHLILFMVKWFERIFKVPSYQLKASLNIYPQQNEGRIKEFWSQLTNIPIENFGKSYIKPANKGYKKNNLYYGTIRIVVPKGTDMRHRTFGWIKAALKNLDPQIDLAQKEWKSLREISRPINLPEQVHMPR